MLNSSICVKQKACRAKIQFRKRSVMSIGLYGKYLERAYLMISMPRVVSNAYILCFFLDPLTSPSVEIHVRQTVYSPAGTAVHRITAWARRGRSIGSLTLAHFLVNIEIGVSIQNHCIYNIQIRTKSNEDDPRNVVWIPWNPASFRYLS